MADEIECATRILFFGGFGEFQELNFIENRNAEFLGFGEFGAGFFAGYEVIGGAASAGEGGVDEGARATALRD